MKTHWTAAPNAKALIAAGIRREKTEAAHHERDVERAYLGARSEAASQLTLGQIIFGEQELVELIPCDHERVIWKLLHKRVVQKVGLVIEIKVTNPDGSPGVGNVYFPAVVKEYLLQLARNAALHGDDTDAAAAGGAK